MGKQYVRYVGPVHRRVITDADWKSVRISAETVVWEASNGFAVPLSVFTEEQISKAIKPDSGFVITAEDEEFEPVAGPYDMTPREHVQWVENPVDVVELLNGLSDGSKDLSTVPSVPADAAPTGNTNLGRRAEAKGDKA